MHRAAKRTFLAVATTLVTLLTLSAMSMAATVTASVSADPTEEKLATITISGTTEVQRSLFVYVGQTANACPSLASSAGYPFSAVSSTFGDTVPAGSFSRSYDYTPADSGTYRICAYVSQYSSDTANARLTQDFVVRVPTATVSATVSPDPTEEKLSTITVSGTTEVQRSLFVYVAQTTNACPSLAARASYPFTAVGSQYGEPIAAGAFRKTYDYTPADSGAYRVCTYVSQTSSDTPNAKAAQDFEARPPVASLTVTVSAPTFTTGQSVTATVRANTAGQGRRLVFDRTDGNECPASPDRYTPEPVAIPAGVAVERTLNAVPTATDSRLKFCAWITETSGPEAAASAESVRAGVPLQAAAVQPRVTLVTENNSEQYDRLRLRWSSNFDTEDVWIWDEDPETGADPLLIEPNDSDAFEFTTLANGDRLVRVRRFLGFRQFWWQVRDTSRSDSSVSSEVRSVTVVPSPLDRSKARASIRYSWKRSSRAPGAVRLKIVSSPRARVSVTVSYRGRRFAKRKYIEGVGGLRGFDFKLSCARTGTFPFVVRIEDPYGEKVTRRGSWSLSAARCARLRAAERPKPKRRPASSGGSGRAPASNCDPNYSGACLNPNASDYDCAGGSGNGPLYVDGPIRVVGTDHYDLDADGDGVACES